MKPMNDSPNFRSTVTRSRPLSAGRAYCRKVLEQITRAKDEFFAEFAVGLKEHQHLLRLALNEAESLAWQTKYPQLVFADLATEKVQAVIEWDRHQQAVRHVNPISLLAA